jgi:hypothetical protein
MKAKRLTGILLLIVFLSVLAGGCATTGTSSGAHGESFVTASYKTLATAADVYDTGMKTAGALYKKGLITEAQKEAIIKAGKKYYNTWQLAKKALVEYKKAQTSGNQSVLEAAIDAFTSDQGEFLKLLQSIIGGV